MRIGAAEEDEGLTARALEAALQELRCRPRPMWLDLARGDQSTRWRRGQGIPAEVYFAQLPELASHDEEALVLICGEVELRRELGDQPSLAEYQHRFPHWSDALALQFDVSRLLDAPLDSTDSDAAPGHQEFALPGYEILSEVGRGASGIVYQARQLSLNRLVAIKVMPHGGSDEKRIARQLQEAEILGRLQHPNIVNIYEVAHDSYYVCLIMEFVQGQTLNEYTRGRPLLSRDAAQLTLSLAETVHVVHEADILHRDLKPSNVLMTSTGQSKVTDFGLAKLRSNANLLTTQDSILGTPSYMAPEQAGGQPQNIGRESDVYSLGAILYELLTGRPPFLGATALETLSLIRDQDPVPPRQLQPHTSRDLETICLKCLNKAPQKRYPTAIQLAEDLHRFLEGAPILARRAGPTERLGRFVQRKPAWAVAAMLLVLFLGAAAVAQRISREQRRQLAAGDLVESIARADAQALPQLLTRLPEQRTTILPLLRAELAASPPEQTKWVNLSVAVLAADRTESADAALLKYLAKARSGEISIIVPILGARSEELFEQLWKALLEEGATDGARLRLACLAARLSPTDARWSAIAPAVAQALVHQHPLDIGTMSTALMPAHAALIPALVKISCEPQSEPEVKNIAVGVLRRFAADQPQTLVELTADANPEQFRLLLPSLQEHAETVLPQLEGIAEAQNSRESQAVETTVQTKHDIESAYDAAQHRRANAIAAMWQLGRSEIGLQSLRKEANPAIRAWLIELLGPLNVPAQLLWQNAQETTDSSVRQALVLALGQAQLLQMRPAERHALEDGLSDLYCKDPDAGVHSACEWLLRVRLGIDPEVQLNRLPEDKIHANHAWCSGSNHHVLSVFHGPIEFQMGSSQSELIRENNEVFHTEQIDHSYCLSTKEVTIAQFSRFRDKANVNRQYSPTDDCPVNDINWFEAAAYCRWLSEQEGLPEAQMCYPPVNEIQPGMTLPSDWIKRAGYRLPTAAEWEYACRGGTKASRFCGEGGQLLVHYAWYLSNSDDRAWPVGQLKPNNYGMFDMLGNVVERCHDAVLPDAASMQRSNKSPQEFVIDNETWRELRGGDFGDPNQNVRSARRNANAPSEGWASVGFRVARSL